MLEYRSVDDLNRIIVDQLERVPQGIDLVVGVPRSGMLPATLIALYLNLPLLDLESYVRGCDSSAGARLARSAAPEAVHDTKRVLIVDDSLLSGESMARARCRLASRAAQEDDLVYCTIYIHPDARENVDVWFEQLVDRVFEWNIMNHSMLANSCVDIDGVLCRDPTDAENDDGPMYIEFLQTVPPLYRPTFTIGWLVTSRLERYRSETEAWLARNGYRYGKLIMLDMPTAEARRAANCHARFKADVYRQTGAALFIESDSGQAHEIAGRVSAPVFCVGSREMLYRGGLESFARNERRIHAPTRAFKRWLRRHLPNACRVYDRVKKRRARY